MVTKGIVKRIISKKEIEINIPMFALIEEEEDEEQVNENPKARICTVPGCYPNYKTDDIVMVSIENNDLNNVMIMGRFIPDDESIGTSSAEFENITVKKDSRLSKNTTIGEVSAESISYLKGVNSNIQNQFDTNMTQKIELLKWLTSTFNSTNFN
jgi:hypothetical protein